MKQRAWLLAVVIVTTAPMTARADEESDGKNRAAAGQAYREGQRQYDLNDFAKALDLFKRAYTLYDEPALLYNIAQCYRQPGDEEQAIKFYKSYLRKVPNAPNRDDVTRLLAGLEQSYNEKRASSERQRAESDALAKQRAQADAAERAARAAQLEADATARRRALEQPTTPPVPRQPVYKKWWLWTTVALVAAAGAGVGVGVYYGTRPAQPALGYHDGPGATALFWSLGTVANDGKVVYIADNGNAVIRTYDLATGTVATLAGQAGKHGGDDGPAAMATFDRPEGQFLDGTTLYVTDGNGNTIRKIDLTTNVVSTIAGQFHSSGSTDGIGSGARFGYPLYIVGDHADHLYIDDGFYTIRRLTISTGEVKTIAGATKAQGFVDAKVGTDARFGGPYGLAIEGRTLYVCDASPVGAAMRAVDLDTFAVGTAAGSFTSLGIVDERGANARLTSCTAAVGDGLGHVCFGDAGVLRQLDVTTGAVKSIAGKPATWAERPGPLGTATLSNISGLTVLPSGDLVFDDFLESDLLEVRLP